MSAGLMALVTACYLGVMWAEAKTGNHPMVVVFAGYSLANVGLIWSLWR